MKKLGFGLMRLPTLDPSNAAAIDMEQVKRMVDRFLERGFAYFDTAAFLDEVLTKHPKMKFVQLQLNYLDWESEWKFEKLLKRRDFGEIA